jgi:aminomethyltransferase
MTAMSQRTFLYEFHRRAGAKIVNFSGWEMPLHYGSQIKEHQAVRRDVGVFDVSHMSILDITGSEANKFLRYVLANDIQKLDEKPKALYTCMLNPRGGVIDDLIVYRLANSFYRLILNAGSREKDNRWLQQQGVNFTVDFQQRSDLSMLAVQGPNSIKILNKILKPAVVELLLQLKPFSLVQSENKMIARTGYTGEDGFEIILPHEESRLLWQQLLDQQVAPCGLGARDTLRLEAGFNLYGNDMDETVSPLESNLEWTIAWDNERNFIGKDALIKQKQLGIKHQLVGLIMQASGVLRNQQEVYFNGDETGIITSGGFSPTLEHAIAFARVPVGENRAAFVNRYGTRVPVKLVTLPFVRHGKSVYKEIGL